MSSGYNIDDFLELWDAIFSLPQIEQVEIALGKELTDKTGQPQLRDLIYESWAQFASRKRLKSIILTVAANSSKVNFNKLLSFIAQTYSFRP